jgi:pimeloyl-ACP methyl ester carboxylesterase
MSLVGLTLVLLIASWFLAPLTWAKILLAAGRRWGRLRPAWIEINGCRWHYLHGGEGPVLITLHGFGADGDNWLRVAPALTKNFRVIAPDLPGFGRSSGEDLKFDIDSQVERLHALVEALGVSPVVMAGNSMGGWISAAYGARFPGEIKALWLLAPLGVKESKTSPMLKSISRGEKGPFHVGSIAQFRKRVLKEMFEKLPWFPFPLQVYYTEEAIKLSRKAPGMFRQVVNSPEALESIAQKISIPVLFQWGDRDRAVDVSGAAPLERALKSSTVKIQTGTGHIPMLETPSASIGFFNEFRRQHNLP